MEINEEEISYRFADINDVQGLEELLNKCELHINDINEHLTNFIIAKIDDKIIGSVGLEIYGSYGLLRSLAVEEFYRKKGIANNLYSKLIAYAHLKGVRIIYLLTITAESFFQKLGFEKIQRDKAPEQIMSTAQFKILCPQSAVCMTKKIDMEAIYFPEDILSLQPNVPGARMWKVALEKTMLTYFEIEPGCRFEKHNHESEQITMVLEGELFFEIDDKVICLKKNEVIAIPSFVNHSAYTKNLFVKAVDAWSPVRKF